MCAETLLGGIELGEDCSCHGYTRRKICERESLPTTAPESVLPKIVDWFKARPIVPLGVGAFGPRESIPDLPSYFLLFSRLLSKVGATAGVEGWAERPCWIPDTLMHVRLFRRRRSRLITSVHPTVGIGVLVCLK